MAELAPTLPLTCKHQTRVLVLVEAFSHLRQGKNPCAARELSRLPDDVARLIALYAVGTHIDSYRMVKARLATWTPLLYNAHPVIESQWGVGSVPWLLLDEYHDTMVLALQPPTLLRPLVEQFLKAFLVSAEGENLMSLAQQSPNIDELRCLSRALCPLLLHKSNAHLLVRALSHRHRRRLLAHRIHALRVARHQWLYPSLASLARVSLVCGLVGAWWLAMRKSPVQTARVDRALRAISSKDSAMYKSPVSALAMIVATVYGYCHMGRALLQSEKCDKRTCIEQRAHSIFLVTAVSTVGLLCTASFAFGCFTYFRKSPRPV
jgi:hypothetical protein